MDGDEATNEFRLRTRALARLSRLSRHLGVSEAAVLEMVIQEKARNEKRAVPDVTS